VQSWNTGGARSHPTNPLELVAHTWCLGGCGSLPRGRDGVAGEACGGRDRRRRWASSSTVATTIDSGGSATIRRGWGDLRHGFDGRNGLCRWRLGATGHMASGSGSKAFDGSKAGKKEVGGW